ncbi:MAG: LysR family transcriptional regulator [Spirochaetota bacterium]
MIDREHLAILHALARHGSLTKAADALHLTQSALSHSVRRLEERAGVRLWERDGRALRLTQAGTYLTQLAERIVPQLEDADDALAGFAAGRRGTLRIGMECHPCYEWLLTVLPAFLSRNPDVDVDVIQRFQFTGREALTNHEIDLLITPDPMHAPGLEFEAVLPYELRLVAAADLAHPAGPRPGASPAPEAATAVSSTRDAPPPDTLSARDFLTLDVLTYPVPRDRLDLFTQLLIPAGIEPRSVRQVEATEVMLELVRAGRGVTALPDWMVERLRPGVRDYRLGEDGIHKVLALGYRREDGEVRYLRDFVLAAKNVRKLADRTSVTHDRSGRWQSTAART